MAIPRERMMSRIQVGHIDPVIQRQPIGMFCSKHRHIETWYYHGVETVAEAIAYIEQYGLPRGVSMVVWTEMVSRMQMWRG